jgi:hypothetical protein
LVRTAIAAATPTAAGLTACINVSYVKPLLVQLQQELLQLLGWQPQNGVYRFALMLLLLLLLPLLILLSLHFKFLGLGTMLVLLLLLLLLLLGLLLLLLDLIFCVLLLSMQLLLLLPLLKVVLQLLLGLGLQLHQLLMPLASCGMISCIALWFIVIVDIIAPRIHKVLAAGILPAWFTRVLLC